MHEGDSAKSCHTRSFVRRSVSQGQKSAPLPAKRLSSRVLTPVGPLIPHRFSRMRFPEIRLPVGSFVRRIPAALPAIQFIAISFLDVDSSRGLIPRTALSVTTFRSTTFPVDAIAPYARSRMPL